MKINSGRVVSVDALRGLAVALMILVIHPGSHRDAYVFLRHAPWNGCTLADMVFPLFLFAVGCVVPLSIGRRLGAGASRLGLARKVCLRAALLVGIGFLLSIVSDELILDPLGYPWATVRIMGVLQRIGICYLVTALVYLLPSAKVRFALPGVLCLVYLAGMIAYRGSAGAFSSSDNFCIFLDRLILGSHVAPHFIEPEGVWSSLGAIATSLAGMLVAVLFLCHDAPFRGRRRLMALWGLGLFILGLVLSPVIPVNKSIWTPSYSLLMTGISMLLMALLEWTSGKPRGRMAIRPLVIYGGNAIVVYAGARLLLKLVHLLPSIAREGQRLYIEEFYYDCVLAPLLGPSPSTVVYGLTFVLVWYLVSYFLNRRGLYIRV